MKKWLSYLIMLCLVLNLTTGFTVTVSAEGVEAFTDEADVYGEEDVYTEEDVYGETDVYDEDPVEIFEGDAEDDTSTVSDPAEPDGFTGDEVSGEVEEDDTDITGVFEDGAQDDMFASSGEAEETKTPLTFTAVEANSTVSFKWYTGDNVQYRTNGATNWIDYTMGETIKLVNIGDTVSFKGNDVVTTSMKHFSITGKVAASGDVTSLTNGVGGDVRLSDFCYDSMFRLCSGLTEAPKLPSTTLAEACYQNMFSYCSGLTEAPELPATHLENNCYREMFVYCEGLTKVPELPATFVGWQCYYMMFFDCYRLEIVKEKDIVHSIPWTIKRYPSGDFIFSNCTNVDLDGNGSKEPVSGVTYYQKNPNAQADIYAVNAVADKINAIKTVTYTPECKTKIDAARTAYEALTEDQKEWIEEDLLKTLTDAETRYNQLKEEKEEADIAAAQAVADKIKAIKTVTYTPECKTKIDAARTAYDALTSDQKTRITARQLKILTDAEARYEKLKEQDQRTKNTLKMNAKLKATQTGSQINITWGKADGVDGYKVYATNCGKNFNAKYAVQVKGKDNTSLTLKKVNGKAIDLKKSYRIYVEAYKIVDGKTVTLGTTIKAHVVGRKNAKYSNVKSISLNKTSYTLKKGKTAKIQGKTILEDKTKKQLTDAHAKTFRFRTSNKNVATVSANGTIKAVGKGTCTIYVYAVNGCAKNVKVTVK